MLVTQHYEHDTFSKEGLRKLKEICLINTHENEISKIIAKCVQLHCL